MVHSFETILHNNGNISIQFRQDSKLRKIIFQKGTEAYEDLYNRLENDTDSIQDRIKSMRNRYRFTVNPNNPSIFRPIRKNIKGIAL